MLSLRTILKLKGKKYNRHDYGVCPNEECDTPLGLLRTYQGKGVWYCENCGTLWEFRHPVSTEHFKTLDFEEEKDE